MDRETARTSGGVNHVLIDRGLQQFHAHVDDVSRRKILTFLCFAHLYRKVFEGFVDNLEVRVEEFDVLEKRSTGDEVSRRQVDSFIGKKNVGPLVLGRLK